MKKKFFDNILIAQLTESLDGGNKYKCIIIKPGITSSANTYTMHQGKRIPVKKNYPKEVLKDAADKGFFEGATMILRSEADHLSQDNDSIKNSVGYFTETKWNESENYVEGVFNVKQSKALSSSFKEHLKKLWETTKNIGLSITGLGEWVVEKIQNEWVATVSSLEDITSIDACRVGNAGGKIISLVESELNIKNNFSNQNNYKMDPKQRLALFAFLVALGKIEKDVKESELTDDQILEAASSKDMADFYKDYKAEKEDDKDDDKDDEDKKDDKKEDDGKDDKSDKVKEVESMLAEAKKLIAKNKLTEILGESKLNQKAKDLIEARIKRAGYVFNETELKAELVAQAKLLSEASDSAFFKGMSKQFMSGFQDVKMGTEQDDKYSLGMQWLLSNAAIRSSFTPEEKKQFQEAGVTGLISMKEFYKELTGDYAITGKEGKGKLAEAIASSTYPALLGDALHRTMIRAYKMSAYQTDWRKIVKIVPRTDFKANTIVYKGGYGNLPTVAEGAPYVAATTPAEQAQQYAVTKKGNIETITREAMFNDDLSVFQDLPFEIGEAAARTIYEFAFNFIVSNPTMGYDSVALFHASHNNLVAGAVVLSSPTFEAGRIAMFNQTDLTNAKKLGYMPKYLLVPIELQNTAYQLTTPAYGQNNATPSFNQTWNVEPIVIAHATDATDWFLVGDPMRGVPTIEIGFLNGREDPEILLQDQPTQGNVFTNDTITYKVRHEYNGAVMNHRGFYKYAQT